MSAVYPSAVTAFMNGEINLASDLVKAQLTEGYVYDPAHSTLADVASEHRLGDPSEALPDLVVDGAAGIRIDPVTTAPAGHTVDGIVFYQDTGDGEASRLICHIDRRADTVPLAIATNGGWIGFDVDLWLRL